VLDNVENKKASDGKERRCCERLRLELNSVALESKYAMEIIRILKEEIDSAVMEVRNSAGTVQSKYNDSDLPNSEGTWFQVQRNRNSEKTDKLKDWFKKNSILSRRVYRHEQVLVEHKEEMKTRLCPKILTIKE
jgi:hypothetical protein